MPFTTEELTVIQNTAFQNSAASALKQETESVILQSPAFNEHGEAEGLADNAIFAEIKHTKKTIAINNLRSGLIGTGYYPYISEENHKHAPDKITILKTNDQFDILRFRKTNGANYDIDTDGIIAKLSEWNDKYGLHIIGADFDWVSFELHSLPEDMEAFGEEVYEFCPDSVDQGFETVERLVQAISYWQYVQLWWD